MSGGLASLRLISENKIFHHLRYLRPIETKVSSLKVHRFLPIWLFYVKSCKQSHFIANKAVTLWLSKGSLDISTPQIGIVLISWTWTKTCYTLIWSLKRPDFKIVIFKMLEISSCDSPAKQHSRLVQIRVDQAKSAVLPSWWIPGRYL